MNLLVNLNIPSGNRTVLKLYPKQFLVNIFNNNCCPIMQHIHYRQSTEFQLQTAELAKTKSTDEKMQNKEEKCMEYVISHVPAGDPQKAIAAIDQFCSKYWMMNLGPEKAKIPLSYLTNTHPKVLVEIGGYCGYSALTWAANTPADTQIYSIEISEKFAGIAKKILQHAGVAQKVHFFIGTVSDCKDKIKALGKIDFLFIDHEKSVYLSDFKIIESLGVIQKGSIVVGDNIIEPGAPDYLQYFKENKGYDSILYHAFVEYWDKKDAVLVSTKL